jgi:hypothetical protein
MKPTGSNSFKGRRSHSGRSVKLNEGLDKRLASYAAAARAAEVGTRARAPAEVVTRAAGAAGLGLLLTAGPASARIVYTPAYTVFGGGVTFRGGISLDLNHDGITDFNLSGFLSTAYFGLSVSPAQAGNAILGNIQGVLSDSAGVPLTCRVASALPAGHRIGPGSRFGAYRTMNFFGSIQVLSSRSGPGLRFGCGYWGYAQGRFLGFEFTVQAQKYFGWARLNTTADRATLTGYAYETEPNKAIRAGDTGPLADARVPEMHSAPPAVATLRPATLGLLALGSRGLDIWRREQ